MRCPGHAPPPRSITIWFAHAASAAAIIEAADEVIVHP